MRSKSKSITLTSLLMLAAWSILAAGCGQTAELSSPTAQRLRALVYAYLDYAVAKGAGPANEEQLQAHLKNVPGFVLEAGGLSLEQGQTAFVSERDGQPFLIRYGLGVSCGSEAEVIACEHSGKGGKRLVAYTNGKVDCVEKVAAKELVQIELRGEVAEQPRANHASILGKIHVAHR
jgi:hypothetical protein